MAGLESLKKRQHSVEISKQLAGAMKTTSSAKYTRLNLKNAQYSRYSERYAALAALCGDTLYEHDLAASENAPVCYLIIGANKGLNGGYNSELHEFARTTLDAHPDSLNIVCGRRAVEFFREKGISVYSDFTLGDEPEFEECKELFGLLRELYYTGKACEINVIYQSYVNTLTQTPCVRRILPAECINGEREGDLAEMTLFFPDKATVAGKLRNKMTDCVIYKTILEASLGAQSATLMAMRTAYDNAEDTITALETEINKKRQASVTAGVIETSSDMLSKGEDENG